MRQWLARTLVLLVVHLILASGTRRAEEDSSFWEESSKATLDKILNRLGPSSKLKPAKNVILFIGDGMSLSTITAGRIFVGQRQGKPGEETTTSLDQFHHIGLTKVYSIDKQTPDSASTGTALLSGIKTRNKVIGLNGKAIFKNCSSSFGNAVKSILEDSTDKLKSTGIVTTTQVQHATPAAAFAHVSSRSWYADDAMDAKAIKEGCTDIAAQLIEKGRRINVILGGGRAYMRPKGFPDEEYKNQFSGRRKDRRDLITEWTNLLPSNRARYVWNLGDFNSIDPKKTDFLLGLFQPYEMRFDHDRNADIAGEPTLQEMTRKAIKILERSANGFFLLVEGGKIDHAHHANRANVALREFEAFDKAVQTAIELTDPEETLIVVTADHGHVFTVGGYAERGNPIAAFARDTHNPELASDGRKYTSISYGNGPGFRGSGRSSSRETLYKGQTEKLNYRFQTAIPLPFESHSAEDTVVFARGPMSHIFCGLYEQSYVGFAMKYASCVGSDQTLCKSSNQDHLQHTASPPEASYLATSVENPTTSQISIQYVTQNKKKVSITTGKDAVSTKGSSTGSNIAQKVVLDNYDVEASTKSGLQTSISQVTYYRDKDSNPAMSTTLRDESLSSLSSSIQHKIHATESTAERNVAQKVGLTTDNDVYRTNSGLHTPHDPITYFGGEEQVTTNFPDKFPHIFSEPSSPTQNTDTTISQIVATFAQKAAVTSNRDTVRTKPFLQTTREPMTYTSDEDPHQSTTIFSDEILLRQSINVTTASTRSSTDANLEEKRIFYEDMVKKMEKVLNDNTRADETVRLLVTFRVHSLSTSSQDHSRRLRMESIRSFKFHATATASTRLKDKLKKDFDPTTSAYNVISKPTTASTNALFIFFAVVGTFFFLLSTVLFVYVVRLRRALQLTLVNHK